MSDDQTETAQDEGRALTPAEAHCKEYLETGGASGHIRDFTGVGGYPFGATLLIETFGRKSGKRRVIPLCYGILDGEVIIVGSKGGADEHPEWYLNLTARDELTFQIATQACRATWREPEGAERQRIWDYMVGVFPPYADYVKGTDRKIPVVMMKPGSRVDVLKP